MRDAPDGARRVHVFRPHILEQRRAAVNASLRTTAGWGAPTLFSLIQKWRATQDKTANTYPIEIAL